MLFNSSTQLQIFGLKSISLTFLCLAVACASSCKPPRGGTLETGQLHGRLNGKFCDHEVFFCFPRIRPCSVVHCRIIICLCRACTIAPRPSYQPARLEISARVPAFCWLSQRQRDTQPQFVLLVHQGNQFINRFSALAQRRPRLLLCVMILHREWSICSQQ